MDQVGNEWTWDKQNKIYGIEMGGKNGKNNLIALTEHLTKAVAGQL